MDFLKARWCATVVGGVTKAEHHCRVVAVLCCDLLDSLAKGTVDLESNHKLADAAFDCVAFFQGEGQSNHLPVFTVPHARTFPFSVIKVLGDGEATGLGRYDSV